MIVVEANGQTVISFVRLAREAFSRIYSILVTYKCMCVCEDVDGWKKQNTKLCTDLRYAIC
jgi:hypothetical protein